MMTEEFKYPENNILKEMISNQKSEVNIIEIGFEEPGNIFELYHRLGFNKYYGIEKIEESKCAVKYLNESVNRNYFHEIFSEYQDYCKKAGFNAIRKEEFNKTFEFKWGTDILNIIDQPPKIKIEFSIGILRNFLHCFEKKDAKSVLTWLKINSKSDFEVYLRLMSPKYFGYEQQKNTVYPYSEDEIEDLIKGWNIVSKRLIDGFYEIVIKKS